MMKQVTLEEAPLLYELATQSYGTSPWTKTQFEESLTSKWTTTYVYEQDGQWLGFIQVQQFDDTEGEILNVGVHPDYRGQGVATTLMSYILPKAEKWLLEVRAHNTVAQHLYERMGFETIAVRKKYYHQPTEDALIMQRK